MTSLMPTLPPPAPAPEGLGGLLALLDGRELALPLRSVQVRASITGPVVRCQVEQVYENAMDQVMEVVHIFPLPPSAAVHGFRLVAGGLEIVGECKEKGQAKQEYESAKAAGHRAALLEEQREDVHTVRVANIPPGEQIRVLIELSWTLPWQDGRQRFVFPTTIAPRYLPGNPTAAPGLGVLPNTDSVPDASGLQPPVLIGQGSGASLDLQVRIQGSVSQLEVAQHSAKMGFDGGVLVQPTGARLDRDFVLAFTGAVPSASSVQAWTDGSYTLLQLTPPEQDLAQAMPRDATFIVDISGSMQGQKMAAAKLALKTALRGLESWDRFRLIAFDDRIEAYRSAELVALTQESLLAAEAWVEALYPRGGTEMLPALTLGLAPPATPGRLHTVLFITDGQAWNTQELVAAVYHRREEARLFTLGIDTAVNQALMEQLARVGGGTCTLCTPREDIEERVADLEARFGAPILSQAKVLGNPSTCEVFADAPGLLWLEGAPEQVQVSASSAQGLLTLNATPLKVKDLGPAYAKHKIQALMDRRLCFPHEVEGLNPAILALSLKHSVLCELSALVAVDKSARVIGPQVSVVQPAAVPEGWDPSFGAARTPVASPAPVSSSPAPRMRQKSRRVQRPAAAPMGPPAAMAPPSPEPMGEAAPAMELGAMDLEESASATPVFQTMAARAAPEAVVASPSLSFLGLVQSQQVDGSWGNVPRTIAALLILILKGHTRRKGARRRVVAKAARWLVSQPGTDRVLEILAQAEAGVLPEPESLRGWVCGGAEGELLETALG